MISRQNDQCPHINNSINFEISAAATTHFGRRPRGNTTNRLIQGGLLHNPEKLLLRDLAVSVSVGLIDHFLKLLISLKKKENNRVQISIS